MRLSASVFFAFSLVLAAILLAPASGQQFCSSGSACVSSTYTNVQVNKLYDGSSYTCPGTEAGGYCILPDAATAIAACTADPLCGG